jgi:hypothetical protein
VCHARLHKKLVRVLLGFRLELGVRDSVGGAVVVVRHRLFNRHFDVPWEQTLFQLQVGVSAHETLDKLLTETFSPGTTVRASDIRAGQGLKNVLIQTCMSDFMHSP